MSSPGRPAVGHLMRVGAAGLHDLDLPVPLLSHGEDNLGAVRRPVGPTPDIAEDMLCLWRQLSAISVHDHRLETRSLLPLCGRFDQQPGRSVEKQWVPSWPVPGPAARPLSTGMRTIFPWKHLLNTLAQSLEGKGRYASYRLSAAPSAYSLSGRTGPRCLLISLRRRFSSRRFSRTGFVGLVGYRFLGTFNASRKRFRNRSTTSCRLRNWLRVDCDTRCMTPS